MLDFTALMATAQKQGWALGALDCAVDTTTPAGEAMANVLATFAQFERRLISLVGRHEDGPCGRGREFLPEWMTVSVSAGRNLLGFPDHRATSGKSLTTNGGAPLTVA